MNLGERIGPVDEKSTGWILLYYRGIFTQPGPYEKIVSNMAECKSCGVYRMGYYVSAAKRLEEEAIWNIIHWIHIRFQNVVRQIKRCFIRQIISS